MRKIDAFSHVLPQEYYEALNERSGGSHVVAGMHEYLPALSDVDERLALMDRYDVDEQVLVPANPPVETVADRVGAHELARTMNDGIADIVADHPDRFRGVATVPMNNPEAMVTELDRVVADLDLAGVLLYTSIDNRRDDDPHIEGPGRPLDVPELEPFFERVAHHDVPVWLHPLRPKTNPDYIGERESKYVVWQMFGWPYELAAAMARLVFSGVMDRHDLTVIAHHAGAMVPLVADRMAIHYDLFEATGTDVETGVSRPYVEKFREFYVDTATFGNVPALRNVYEFFGPDHVLFGTDAPFDAEGGDLCTAENARAVTELNVSDDERERIFAGNVERLLD